MVRNHDNDSRCTSGCACALINSSGGTIREGFLLVVCGLIPPLGAGCSTLNAARSFARSCIGEQRARRRVCLANRSEKKKQTVIRMARTPRRTGRSTRQQRRKQGRERGNGPNDDKRVTGARRENRNGKSDKPSDNEEPEKPDRSSPTGGLHRGKVVPLARGEYNSKPATPLAATRRAAPPHLIPRSSASHCFMFADWFEFRIGQNFSHTRVFGATDTFTINGGEDLYLGIKLGLTEQKKFLPECTDAPDDRSHRATRPDCGANAAGDELSVRLGLERILESRRKYPGNSAVDDN